MVFFLLITMKNTPSLLSKLLIFQYFLVLTAMAMAEEKEEAALLPVTTLSPPEGNTTFLGGTSWCVARPGSSSIDLQVALDWACGLGKADCGPIQRGGPCFEPDNLLFHASYAFNNYYQQNGNSDIACYFGGTAVLTQNNPSNARCVFATSESIKSSSPSLSENIKTSIWGKFGVVFLLVYLGRR